MIQRIDINNINIQRDKKRQQPQFKGVGEAVLNGIAGVIQTCEAVPMVNVAVIDLSTAIVPRTIIETQTNPYAGLEAFRRESSGLIINCMIPGLIVAGIAGAIHNPIMGKGAKNMAKCWANEDTIDLVSKYWENASDAAIKGIDGKTLFEGDPQQALKTKAFNTIKNILDDTTGADGKETKVFKDLLSETKGRAKVLNPEAEKALKTIINNIFIDADKAGKISRKALKTSSKEVSKAYGKLLDITHIDKNIKIGDSKKYFTQSMEDIFKSTPNIIRELANGKFKDTGTFTKTAKKLLNLKGIGGLVLVLPMAISAQPFNRWLTKKTSGKKGAPIYKDFTETESKELNKKEKAALNRQKLVSVSSMIGVALLSTMQKPNMGMLKDIVQFKSIFPSMNQARIISAATFSSRMMASEDKNDLREATVRDIASFASFYFLGDYVAKAIACLIQKINPKIKLINELKPKDPNANILKKFWHWMKHTALKSTKEIYGATDKMTKTARNMRALCQIGNIAFSLIALGLVIPKMYRGKTEKNRKAELEKMGVDHQIVNKYYPSFTNAHEIGKKNYFETFSTPKAG